VLAKARRTPKKEIFIFFYEIKSKECRNKPSAENVSIASDNVKTLLVDWNFLFTVDKKCSSAGNAGGINCR
jgi:hypothetical protein